MKSQTLYWLFPFLLFSMLWGLGDWGVTETSEARYAEIGREVITTGEWLKPNLLGIYHFDKPPMTYWITAVGIKLFGANAFAVRFFPQLFYLLQIWFVFQIALKLFSSEKKAIYSAFIYAGLPLVVLSARVLTTDIFLNTFELLAILCLVSYFKKGRRLVWLYGFFVALGLALFTKGPVGMLIPLSLIYPVRKILGVEDRANGFHVSFGLLVMALVGGWWFVYLMMTNQAFYDFFIGEQLVDRVANAEKLRRSKPLWYYLKNLPLACLPFIFLVPLAMFKGFREKAKELNLVGLFWVIIPLFLFSLSSSKLVLYVLPLTGGIALCGGWLLDEATSGILKWVFAVFVAIYLLLFIGLAGLFAGQVPNFSFSPSNATLVFLSLGVFMVLGIALIRQDVALKIALLSLVFPLIAVPISTDLMSQLDLRLNSTRSLTDFLKQKGLANQNVIVWNRRVPSLSFNLEREIYSVKYKDHLLAKRHTEFQADDSWKMHMIDAQSDLELGYLCELLESPSVFIAKDSLPESHDWILTAYNQKKEFGEWVIYFKK